MCKLPGSSLLLVRRAHPPLPPAILDRGDSLRMRVLSDNEGLTTSDKFFLALLVNNNGAREAKRRERRAELEPSKCVDCNCKRKPLDPNHNLSACVGNQQCTSDTRNS